ncbi:MAG TPA: 2-amino-4-hydroxy-6-hydroxymethyldihydropteridine diphosphokinase [Leeuwenhoekiella sp.]|nr:2-amino-4-hydroxy-6-hydroxymethyldihydropteridine diphosphokinase [Leeuwenhoekiella sp.]
MKTLTDTYLSLGGNQGDTLKNLQRAVDLLYERVGFISRISPVYKTESWGFEGPDFLNAALCIKTRLSGSKVLDIALKIEQELGRQRNSEKESKGYENRPIDIDLLLYGDELKSTQRLQIPHPRMQERQFVLRPLYDIAPQLQHPQLKKTVKELLAETKDTTGCTQISATLENPRLKFNLKKHHYIAIEGNIGAGKTTLSTLIAEEFNAKLILERFKENPFLPKFYKDQSRYAFPLEMSFLADRYQQLLDDIGQFDLFKDFMIADYDSYKSLIFAQITLGQEEFSLYKKLHGMMYRELAKPSLYVYLYQNTERLLSNIKKRGRSYEQDISHDYLSKINDGYLQFIKTRQQANVKIIDISTLDFVSSRADYLKVLSEMCRE